MIRNLLTNIYVTSRLLVSLGAVAAAFFIPSFHVRAIIITLTFLYFSLAILSYYKLKLGHYINKYLDVLYFAGFFTFSSIYTYPLSLISIGLFSPRQSKVSFLITAESLAFDIYKAHQNIPYMLFLASLQLGILVASMCPDIISALKKEHHKISNLRIAYKDMLKHLDVWEKDQLRHQESKFILEKAIESKNIDEFMEALKNRFDLVDISIRRIESVLPYETKKDYKNGVLQVSLPKDGYSIILNAEFANPIDLYNENLMLTLEYAAGICSLSYMERVSRETLIWANHEVA
ncbi:MAG: hypothetical protein ACP5S8_03280 [Hydrogenobaculum sp.]